jgi:hypothetical protein
MGGYGEEMGDYGGMMGGYGTPAARFNPLGYRIVMTRRRIKSQLLLVKEGLVGPGGPLGADKGVLARASDGEQKDYVNKAIKGIDDIIAIIDANEETEMQPMIEKLSGGVQLLENNCEVVVTLPGEEGEMLDEGLLNPLGLPDGMSGPDAPADAASPAAPTAPGPGPAATPPAGAAPAAGPGPAAAPAAGEPAAAEPGLGEVPTGQPPAGGGPPAAPPAGGANP